MTVTEKLKTFSPILVRLLARHRYGRPMTDDEIAARSGCMFPFEVTSCCWMTTWEYIHMTKGLAFLRGCGLDLDDTEAWRRTMDYIRKRPTFRYLRTDKEWESRYLPMMRRWREWYGVVTPSTPMWPPMRNLLIRLNPLIT